MTPADFHPDAEKDRNFVTALARGLDVLRCFQRGEAALTNTDFAERTGLPKPTVSRLTHTLCKLDYLIADPRTGTYRLGAGVLNLGFGVLAGMDIAERGEGVMRALRNGPNSYITVALGQRHQLEVVYIAVQRSREDVALTMNVGSRLPLFHSAIGRAILAGMDEDEAEEVLQIVRAEQPRQLAECTTRLADARTEFEQRGICTGYGEWRADVNGAAVPVFPLGSGRVLGLNVGGPSFHVKRRELETHYAQELKRASAMLSLKPQETD